jgi:F-type H+-transporting ATPase subunit b
VRRTSRVVLAGTTIVTTVVLLLPTIAMAAEAGGKQEAPNPILPESNEIIWGAISFLLLFFALAKFAFPPVKKAMDARSDKIRSSLDEAEGARTEAQQILDEYQRQLADARNEAGRIIEEARQAADGMRRDLVAKAEAEANEIRARAQADIQTQVERATADLRTKVAELAVESAEMVLQQALQDRDAQLQLVENYINQVTAGGGSRS